MITTTRSARLPMPDVALQAERLGLGPRVADEERAGHRGERRAERPTRSRRARRRGAIAPSMTASPTRSVGRVEEARRTAFPCRSGCARARRRGCPGASRPEEERAGQNQKPVAVLEVDGDRAGDAERDAERGQRVGRDTASARAAPSSAAARRRTPVVYASAVDRRALRRGPATACGLDEAGESAPRPPTSARIATATPRRDARGDVEPEVVAGRHDREPDPGRPEEPERLQPERAHERPPARCRRSARRRQCRLGIAAYGFDGELDEARAVVQRADCASVSTKPNSGNIRGGAVGSST